MKFLIAFTESRPYCNPSYQIVNEIINIEKGELMASWFLKEKEKRYEKFKRFEVSFYPITFLGYWSIKEE